MNGSVKKFNRFVSVDFLSEKSHRELSPLFFSEGVEESYSSTDFFPVLESLAICLFFPIFLSLLNYKVSNASQIKSNWFILLILIKIKMFLKVEEENDMDNNELQLPIGENKFREVNKEELKNIILHSQN